MRIQHNIPAMSSYRNYTRNVSAVNKNLEKLSSGYRINRAGDDAAGLAISEKMRLQISGLEQAQNNAKSGINLVQTAEGALTEVHDMLNRMYTLAEQSANGTYSDDVDREQLQKEVNSLRTEINRIADATNYNGINLLDGSLGVNSKAFDIEIGAAKAVAATDGVVDMSKLLAPESTTDTTKLHLEGKSAEAQVPTASIDLNNLKLTIPGKAAGATEDPKASVTINVAGTDYKVELKNNTADSVDKEATDIGGALVTAMTKSANGVDVTTGKVAAGGVDDNDGIKIGNGIYSIANTDGVIALTYKGYMDGETFVADDDGSKLTEGAAASINSSLGFDVKVTGHEGDMSGDVVHKATLVDQAIAPKTASLAGIDLKLSTDFVKDGGELTIENKTFKFKVGADSTVDGDNVIDLSAYEEGDEDLLHAAADLLSKETVDAADAKDETRTWAIGVNGDGTTIHIEQKTASASGKELDTYKELSELISAKGVASEAKGAGTTIKVTDGEVKEGDTLNINGKTYTFSDKKTGDGYVAIKGGAAANLTAALASDTSVVAENKEGTITIRNKDVEGDAPAVLGKGLSLQIGDTADEFNKMTVSVRDMHAISMGIGEIDISSQDGASAAMAKIKAATNYVSDARGDLGALQNRLDHTINNLSVTQENIQDAESTIRDVDIAKEMMAYTKNNILVQSAQAMLAQANQLPQGVLQLLG